MDAEWNRQKAIINDGFQSTAFSPAFVLNWDFKPEPEPEYHEEVDEQDLVLPFQYKPDSSKEIDLDAVRAQSRSRFVDSTAFKAAMVNLKKRKSDEDLEKDKEEIKIKYEALKGKIFSF